MMLLMLDLDGTLVDLGVKPRHIEELRSRLVDLFSPHGFDGPFKPLMGSLKEADRVLERRGVSPESRRKLQQKARRMLDDTEMQALPEATPLRGAGELLEYVNREDQIVPVLVTSNGRAAVEAILRSLGWQDTFAAVVCRDDVEETKPSAQPLLAAIEAADPQERAERVMFVGDHVFDVRAARRLAETTGRTVEAVALAGGRCAYPDLLREQPDMLLADLPHLLARLAQPRFDLELSMVLFAFNEAENVTAVLQDNVDFLRQNVRDFELIFVNDGSTDRTGALADEFAERNHEVRVVHHSRNRGIGIAVQTGFAECRKEWVTIGPADGQVTAETLSELFPLTEGNDLVLCRYRDRREKDGLFRLFLSNGLRMLTWMFTGVSHPLAGAYMVRLSALKRVPLKSQTFFVNLELPLRLLRAGVPTAEGAIEVKPRRAGESKVLDHRRIWMVFAELAAFRLELLREKLGADGG